MIFETVMYLSLIGLVGAVVKAVGWLRDVRHAPTIRREHRNG
jgi:hypothetical protein